MSEDSIKIWFQSIQNSYPGSLANTRSLCSFLDNPQNSFNSIHVAGTNGKGSVTTKCSMCLFKSGYKVGTYTSPHIFSFTERIQVNFAPISEQVFVSYLPLIKQISEENNIALGWFDLYTVVGFLYFRDSQVDWACIEVGLGGSLDNTNVLIPKLSIIVSIGYDHMNILGDTLELITENKAGIIKPGVAVVYGPTVIERIIIEKCKNEGSLGIKVEFDQYLTYDIENQVISRTALTYLESQRIIERPLDLSGLSAKPPFRLQEFQIGVHKIILDVSHNISGIQKLISDLKSLFKGQDFITIFAVMQGKDFTESLKELQKSSKSLYIVSGTNPKLRTSEEILKISQTIPDGSGDFLPIFTSLISNSSPSLILVTGSFYIMQEAWSAIESFKS